jgi:hypothetical protein
MIQSSSMKRAFNLTAENRNAFNSRYSSESYRLSSCSRLRNSSLPNRAVRCELRAIYALSVVFRLHLLVRLSLLLFLGAPRVHWRAFPCSEKFLGLFQSMQICKTGHLSPYLLQSLLKLTIFQSPFLIEYLPCFWDRRLFRDHPCV